jgi:hypothetical protein
MNTISKRYLGYALGAVIALSLMLPVVFGFTHQASAAEGALTADELFGTDATGAKLSGADFASTSGLASGNLVTTISSIIRVAIGFLGIVAVVIVLLGGFKWMTSGGNEDKVKKAKALIFQGIIGLVIVLSAYAIASFVITAITTATNPV